MGNNNCKQWASMVFKDEEDEENWLNWMETSEIENNTQVLSVSPNMQVFPVQPVRDTRFKRKDSKREKVVCFYSNNNKLKELSNPSDNEAENGEMSGGYDEENFDLTKDDINPDKEAPEMNGDFCHFTDDMQTGQFPTGQVNVSLSYDPFAMGPSRIKVQIVKARNLSCKARDDKEDKCGVSCSESYVQVSLLRHNTILKTQCTTTKKGCSEVLYYETWAFDMPNINLTELDLEITGMHRCKHVLTRDHVIGRAMTTGPGTDHQTLRRHWWEALANPGQVINKWHTLWN